ncbi:MAG TPA: CRISPR-associated endonuclease Cas1, partial [Candidatus Bathyarchaeia archaeon]|nr:CRISPR-associated endonuclease Cas1 [Candidatus Bathyarchaeia archaeon]
IAKRLVLAKIEGQNSVLRKYGLRTHDLDASRMVENVRTDDLESARRKLISIEGKFSELYFSQIFKLFSEKLRPSKRQTFKAYDGLNNVFNLGYEMLSWKVHRALIRAKLEPYLGFLHSVQFGKPSLVCDFMELYRYLIDDFLIQYCEKLKKKDFIVKTESLSRGKKGKREYLSDSETNEFMKELNMYFENIIEIPRIKVGKRQTIETLINEEALLFAKFLRNGTEDWMPRIG